MSDIVERLRYPCDATGDQLEAAAEIESLRPRVAELEALLREARETIEFLMPDETIANDLEFVNLYNWWSFRARIDAALAQQEGEG